MTRSPLLDERNDDPVTTTETEQHRLPDRDDDGAVDTNDSLFHNSDEMKEAGTDRRRAARSQTRLDDGMTDRTTGVQ